MRNIGQSAYKLFLIILDFLFPGLYALPLYSGLSRQEQVRFGFGAWLRNMWEIIFNVCRNWCFFKPHEEREK